MHRSALLVAPYGLTGDYGTRFFFDLSDADLSPHQRLLEEIPRSVIWLDDGENPSAGAYFFSSVGFEQPAARLTSIETRILSVTGSAWRGGIAGLIGPYLVEIEAEAIVGS